MNKKLSKSCRGVSIRRNINKIEKVTSFKYYGVWNKKEAGIQLANQSSHWTAKAEYELWSYDLISKVHVLIKAKKIILDKMKQWCYNI